MKQFYLLTEFQMIFLLMLLVLTLCVQTLCVGFGIFNWQYQKGMRLHTLLDGAVWGQLILYLVYLAQARYHMYGDFFVIVPYTALKVLLTVSAAALCLVLCVIKKKWIPCITAVFSVLTLYPGNTVTSSGTAVMLVLVLAFWFVRGLGQLMQRKERLQSHLSAFSVKEAVDTMDSGLLFCRADALADGQILLANQKMEQLMLTLQGAPVYNGKQFYQKLVDGQVQPGCRQEKIGQQPVFTLPDGTVWRFDLECISVQGRPCALLLGSDVTAYKKVDAALHQKDLELARQNRELKAMLENLESVCRSEVMLRTKNRVHDLLGQRISMVLRAVREHRQPDEALLRSFADGLPAELKSGTENFGEALQLTSESFMQLGVQVKIEGRLPPDPVLQKAFYEIAAEGMTNAVRHGFASQIVIRIRHTEDSWTLDIANDGHCKDGPILEGGGLSGIRRRVQRLGGRFSYQKEPCFTLKIQIPEGGAL